MVVCIKGFGDVNIPRHICQEHPRKGCGGNVSKELRLGRLNSGITQLAAQMLQPWHLWISCFSCNSTEQLIHQSQGYLNPEPHSHLPCPETQCPRSFLQEGQRAGGSMGQSLALVLHPTLEFLEYRKQHCFPVTGNPSGLCMTWSRI